MKKTTAIILAILTAGMLFAGCTVQVRDYPGEISGEAGIDYSREENWAYYGTQATRNMMTMESVSSFPRGTRLRSFLRLRFPAGSR